LRPRHLPVAVPGPRRPTHLSPVRPAHRPRSRLAGRPAESGGDGVLRTAPAPSGPARPVLRRGTPMPTTEIRCVCAAARARAHDLYGHLEGRIVWLTHRTTPTSSHCGTLHILQDLPGYLYL